MDQIMHREHTLALLSIAVIILALYSLLTTTLTALVKTNQVLKISIVNALLTIAQLLTLVPFLPVYE